jgi:hypothetical protein
MVKIKQFALLLMGIVLILLLQEKAWDFYADTASRDFVPVSVDVFVKPIIFVK